MISGTIGIRFLMLTRPTNWPRLEVATTWSGLGVFQMLHRAFPNPDSKGQLLTYCGQTRELVGEFHWIVDDAGVDCNVCLDQIRRFKAPNSVTAPSDYVLQS